MSKSDQSAAKKQANQQVASNQANQQSADVTLRNILGTAQGTAASALPSITGTYSDIANTGGADASSPYFTNLATTGGISSDEETAIRNTAGATARSTYQTGADAAARTAAATGGYGLSGAVATDLARQGSQAAATAETAADASIVGLRQGGQIAGAQGLQAGSQNQTQNRLSAAGGLTNVYGMNQNQIASTVDAILRNYQQTGTLNNQDLSILTNLANQPGVFDKIVGTIGTLGGAAAGVIKAVSPGGLG
jgi:hypothetical protein